MSAGARPMPLRVGIANPFSYRPHVAHMEFIARQLEKLGHELYFLDCGGALTNCNSRINKRGIRHGLECYKCRLGGIHSYRRVRTDRLDRVVPLDEALLARGRDFAYSSSATALQVERHAETSAPDFVAAQASLAAGAATALQNTRAWIRDRKLDCVYVFNGRFDLTRAIVEACEAEAVRYVSVERSWFGEGLQLLPQENCLGLRTFHEMCARWKDRPLTEKQALRANAVMARRLTRQSVGEWRQYNEHKRADFSHRRVRFLYLPSSQHEWLGTPDRASAWHHVIEGIEYLFERMGVPLSELVVRGHPGWAMSFSLYGKNRTDAFYRDWARKVGAEYIESAQPVDSHTMMKTVGVVLLNGSSASMEASWLGKPVVTFVPSAFSTSGIARNLFSHAAVDALSEAELEALRQGGSALADPEIQCRQVLRYMYCVNHRLMQFSNYMRAASPFTFDCAEPTDLSSLDHLTRTGELREDDASFAPDDAAEMAVVRKILSGQALDLPREREPLHGPDYRIERRFGYGFLDRLTK